MVARTDSSGVRAVTAAAVVVANGREGIFAQGFGDGDGIAAGPAGGSGKEKRLQKVSGFCHGFGSISKGFFKNERQR